MKTIIYHNPRCSKSRECNLMLQEKVKDFEVINYMDHPFTSETLKEVISLLNIEPIELVRKNEQIWKDNYKGKTLSNQEIIKAMIENPKLIERPIVIRGKKAAIGRPIDKVISIL